jgi:hypothetical protein
VIEAIILPSHTGCVHAAKQCRLFRGLASFLLFQRAYNFHWDEHGHEYLVASVCKTFGWRGGVSRASAENSWEAVYNNPTIWHFRFNRPTPEALVQGRERIYFEHFWNSFAADQNALLS